MFQIFLTAKPRPEFQEIPMLKELGITNFAIIDRLELLLHDGLMHLR